MSSDTFWGAVLGAVLGLIGGLITALVEHFISKKKIERLSINQSARFLEKNENFREILGDVRQISMYTVNSHEVLGQINTLLERDTSITIKNLTILVRKKPNESASDIEHLETNIKMWELLNRRKRIKKLTIIAYDHDPDHYYTVIGKRIAFSGQVLFDDNKPTGTNVDYLPLVFSDSTDIGKQVILNYQRHFDNVVAKYKDTATLYPTTESGRS